MLLQIIEGSEPSDFTLLSDRTFLSSWGLFCAFINSLCKRFEEIHIFLFEKLEFEVLDGISTNFKQKLIFYHYSSDPLGWIDEKSSVPKNFWFQNLVKNFGSRNAAFVIDSLSTFLRYCDFQRFSYNLQNIREVFEKNNKRHMVLASIHRDLCDEKTKKTAEYLSSCAINLATETELSGATPIQSKDGVALIQNLCKIVYKKRNGKVGEYLERFSISKGVVIESKPWTKESFIRDDIDVEQDVKNLEDEEVVRSTFNMSLSKDEEEARKKLVMPYTKSSHLKVRLDEDSSTTQQPGGMIYYEPDDADDFDDEDPDDDLDF